MKLYLYRKNAVMAGIVSVLLLLPPVLHAQADDEDGVMDSIIVREEIVTQDGDRAYEPVSGYFLPRQMAEALPDRLQQRRISDSMMKALRNDDAFWYANAALNKPEAKPRESYRRQNKGWTEGLVWLLIIVAFIVVLVVYLSNNNVKLFRSSKAIKEEEKPAEMDDIFTIPYQQEIDNATRSGNYRLAVRLLFLRLLRGLADKNRIDYSPDRTNFDYLLQTQQASWYPQFFRVTRNYEYVWYGRFEIGREQYDAIQLDFTHLEQQLQNTA